MTCSIHRLGLFLLLASALSVAQLPTMPAVGRSAQTDTGTRPFVPYDGTQENVNLQNGNLNLKIPLLHLPGRNGLDVDLNLEYDSKFWVLGTSYDALMDEIHAGWYEEIRNAYVGVGWHLNVPTINNSVTQGWNGPDPYCTGTTTVILGDGGRYSFRNNPMCPVENVPIMDGEDTNAAQLDGSNPSDVILSLKNGTKIHFPGFAGGATKIVDADGNYITYEWVRCTLNSRLCSPQIFLHVRQHRPDVGNSIPDGRI